MQVKAAVAAVRSLASKTEGDLHRVFSALLKTDVPGSGFDADTVTGLVRLVMYAFPGALFLYFGLGFCCRKRPAKAASKPAASSTTSRKSSKSGKSSRK
jgi:hypothetical protein